MQLKANCNPTIPDPVLLANPSAPRVPLSNFLSTPTLTHPFWAGETSHRLPAGAALWGVSPGTRCRLTSGFASLAASAFRVLAGPPDSSRLSPPFFPLILTVSVSRQAHFSRIYPGSGFPLSKKGSKIFRPQSWKRTKENLSGPCAQISPQLFGFAERSPRHSHLPTVLPNLCRKLYREQKEPGQVAEGVALRWGKVKTNFENIAL